MNFTKDSRGHHVSEDGTYLIAKQCDGLWHAYHNGAYQDTSTLTNAKKLCINHFNGDAFLFKHS